MEGRFMVCPHGQLPAKIMVEYWRGKEFVAGIYPHKDGIRIVSKYMTGVSKEEKPAYAGGQWLPSAVVKLGEKSVI